MSFQVVSDRPIGRIAGRFLCFATLAVLFLPSSSAVAIQINGQKAKNEKVAKKLETFLKTLPKDKSSWAKLIKEQSFSGKELSTSQSKAVRKVLRKHYQGWIKENRKAEMDAKVLKLGNKSMPFWYKVYGKKPKGGRSLYISMHGGG